MMKNDLPQILDDILAEWHQWQKSDQPGRTTKCAMFVGTNVSSRQWDSIDDVIESTVQSGRMEAMDFQVNEMKEPYRTAIYFNARNLATGKSVWTSPRLPADLMERAVIVRDARTKLMQRLMDAGVI